MSINICHRCLLSLLIISCFDILLVLFFPRNLFPPEEFLSREELSASVVILDGGVTYVGMLYSQKSFEEGREIWSSTHFSIILSDKKSPQEM